ncbi:hypothetical protein IRB23M11_18830 [Alkalibacterium sp. m-11]
MGEKAPFFQTVNQSTKLRTILNYKLIIRGGEEVPFCILIDRATIVALKQHEKTKKLVITSEKKGEKV